MNIIISDLFLELVNSKKLELAALAVLQQQEIKFENDFSIVVEGDDRLHELNNEFLGIDAPTDVLSFPAGEDETDPETGIPYLGDIIISYPRAAEQAASAGHPVENELQLLVVHGMLHLLGYDHAEPEEKAEMWTVQEQVLRNLAVTIFRLPE